jgi:hypothetical protein
MSPIGRMYETEDQARVAMQRLQEEGFGEEIMFLVPPGTTAEAMPAGVPRDQAIAYARRLEHGHTLLLVRAAFGWGETVSRIMDDCGPVSTRSVPVLRPRNPAPFSNLIGMPTLSTRGRSYFSGMLPELTRPGFSFSSKFGMKLLSQKKGPRDKSFGMKLLSEKKGPWEKSFGIKLLSQKKGPWEKSFGFPLLKRRR